MIEVIQQRYRQNMSLNEKINVTSEFLQILILKIMSDKGYFKNVAFVGGTSLRILYDLRRFSEDLDFSIHQKSGFDIKKLKLELIRSLGLYALPIEIKMKDTGAVHSLFIKFIGLMKALGLSSLADQKLSVKLEIDMNPPGGWLLQNTIVNKIYLFNITHHDLPSLYAGKLHACFFRRFVKGRDFYDLVWYLSKKIQPNLNLLNAAIKQTSGVDSLITADTLKGFLLDRIQKVNFALISKDVSPFLEDQQELSLLNIKSITETINSIY